MLPSLGFDTVIVNNRMYDDNSLSSLFSFFKPLGIYNFIFISDFDLSANSFSLEREKIKAFKSHLKSIAPYGVHTKVFYNLLLSSGSAFNSHLYRLYANKKKSSLCVTLPIFDGDYYNTFAKDINHLLYKQNASVLINRFDTLLELSDKNICARLLKNPKILFGLELSYILSPRNIDFAKSLAKEKIMFIPQISYALDEYVGVMENANDLLENIGKVNYFELCTRIRKTSDTFGS